MEKVCPATPCAFWKTAMKKNRHPFIRLLFLLYCAIMFWLLFGQRWGRAAEISINLTPFKTILLYFTLLQNDTYRTHAIINLFGNILVFVPLGYLLPKIWSRFRGYFKTILAVALLMVVVELVQYVTALGSLDIDDLILNILGASIGYIFWKIKSS